MNILYNEKDDKFYKIIFINALYRDMPLIYEFEGTYYLSKHAIIKLITRKEISEIKEEIVYGLLYDMSHKMYKKIKDMYNV